MKICLYTFTGTGNTKICGDFIKKYLEDMGDSVDHYVFNSADTTHPNPNDYDMIGIGYPIHAFNIPEVFSDFLKELEPVNNKKYFIYKVSGEPFHLNDCSSYHSAKRLKKKGYNLFLEKHFIMPYNIMFNYNFSLKKQMYLYLEALTKVFAMKIHNEEEELIRYTFGKKIFSSILRIEWIAPKLNSTFVRVDKKKCINCNLCINNCPTKAIYRNDKNEIRINSHCAMCMRCTLNCPTDAIKYGFMNSWKVNGRFNYNKLVNDDSISGDYVNANTKGYFKLFKKYFAEQNKELEEYKIDIPVEYKEEDDLSKYLKNK